MEWDTMKYPIREKLSSYVQELESYHFVTLSICF